jgi:hypothetical protein
MIGYFPEFTYVKEGREYIQHISTIFLLAEMFDELGYRRCGFKIGIGYLGGMESGAGFSGDEKSAAEGTDRIDLAEIIFEKWAG